jgi:N6-adenosine-specific RNA methylase IME4
MRQLSDLPKHYRCIVADPPWPYHSPRAVVGNGGRGSQEGRAAEIIQADLGSHYETMSMIDLIRLGVQSLVQEDAHLYLWTTNSFMEEAHDLARAWGFKPKTIITWGKVRKADKASFEPSCKTGYWFRSATEHCLFAVRGKLRLEVEEAIPTLFLSERLPHSVKPDSFMEMVEKCSPEPRLELFSRKRRSGFDGWGNEYPEEEVCAG